MFQSIYRFVFFLTFFVIVVQLMGEYCGCGLILKTVAWNNTVDLPQMECLNWYIPMEYGNARQSLAKVQYSNKW